MTDAEVILLISEIAWLRQLVKSLNESIIGLYTISKMNEKTTKFYGNN